MTDPRSAAHRWEQVAANTDRELWRKGGGDGNGMSYYEPTIHVTQDERIGINVGGTVFELPVEEWHALAAEKHTAPRATASILPRFLCWLGIHHWRCEAGPLFYRMWCDRSPHCRYHGMVWSESRR